jgi:hypothetical protein
VEHALACSFPCLTLLLSLAAANAQIHIKAITGQVSVRHGDAPEQVAALVNAPLLTDDRIATGLNSRADIQFDSSNTFRLGSNAEVRLMQSAPGRYQTELVKGEISLSSPSIAVDTPSVSVRPANEGVYRIAINAAGESEITVRAGEVEVFAPSGSQRVSAGQKMLARGSPSDPEFKIVRAIPKWRRAARIFLSSVQLGGAASSSSSDDKSAAKTAPKPASKTTPITASNGNSKTTAPTRGNFQPAPSTHAGSTSSAHAAAAPASHTESHSASSTHSASASSDHSSSSSSSHK